jgi:hypothetical protein
VGTRDIPHGPQKRAKFWNPHILGLCGIDSRNISGITQGPTWYFTILPTMCFQFNVLNIYHPMDVMSFKVPSHFVMSHLFSKNK